jgi:hypothetical protein
MPLAVPRPQTSRVLKNSILSLILGGAAVHRCDKRPVFGAGFIAAEGPLPMRQKELFNKLLGRLASSSNPAKEFSRTIRHP